ncbi:coiled-coil domain containing 162 [Mustelus asterias]
MYQGNSVCIPKDISYFRKERELLLKKGLQVAEAKPLLIQADVMQRELESCLTLEYTTDSLPLLLHQFFTDRVHQLVQCKYLHMLRWKRFCQRSSIIEQIYPLYKKQIARIMKEYDDALQRAQRLSAARECLLTETGSASKYVTQEDVVIYLQWLVCHLHSLTTIHEYLRVLQNLPMSHNIEVMPERLSDTFTDDEDKGSTVTLLSSLYAPTRPSTAFSSVSGSAAGTHTISIFNKYSSVLGFEDVFDFEVNLCLPVHKLNIEEFKPLLQFLLSHFGIEYDVDDIGNTANEMELFTLVIRKFRSIFSKEETMKTFPVYDAFESGTKHWGIKGPNMALKKEANWIPFLKINQKHCLSFVRLLIWITRLCFVDQIKPKQDPWQQKISTKLRQQQNMDEILRLQWQFFQDIPVDRIYQWTGYTSGQDIPVDRIYQWTGYTSGQDIPMDRIYQWTGYTNRQDIPVDRIYQWTGYTSEQDIPVDRIYQWTGYTSGQDIPDIPVDRMYQWTGYTSGQDIPVDWMYQWAGYTSGQDVPVDRIYQWAGYTSGQDVPVDRIYQWAGYTSGQDVPVDRIYKWTGYTSGQDIPMDRIYQWTGHTSEQDILVDRIYQMDRIYQWTGYTSGQDIPMDRIYQWTGYTSGQDIPVDRIYQWAGYTSGQDIPVDRIYQWTGYTSEQDIPVDRIYQWTGYTSGQDIPVNRIYQWTGYTSGQDIPMNRIYQWTGYTSGQDIPVDRIYQWTGYTSGQDIPVNRIYQWTGYTSGQDIPVDRTYQIYQWTGYTSGQDVPVDRIYQWAGYTSGLDVPVGRIYQWAGYTSGQDIPVDWMYQWAGYTSGQDIPVGRIYQWTGCTSGQDIPVGRIYQWAGYTSGLDVPVGRIYQWAGYTSGQDVPVGRMYQWTGYTSGQDIPVDRIYQWAGCTSGQDIPGDRIYQWTGHTCAILSMVDASSVAVEEQFAEICSWIWSASLQAAAGMLSKTRALDLATAIDYFLMCGISDPNQVMDTLRQHAVAVHEPYTVQPLAVTSHQVGQHTSYIWNRIYGSANLHQEPRCKESGSPADIKDWEVENVTQNKRTARVFSSQKIRDQGYSYTGVMQLLGLDEGNEENAKDPAMTQGAYLSLLFLRHLRVRELQRLCLGILNYFRSIERTLTISVCGLALNGGKLVQTAADTCCISAEKGGVGVADGMGSHYYLHNTPADYKRSVTEFMEFSEIENHDDFYTTEDGFIHTQDQRGIYIIYDVAIKDLTELEHQLLLLATQYIEKGQTACPAGGSECGEVDLTAWAHLSVDRFAVLLDMWRCEAAFLENKRQLLDCYFEAYQHVFDVEERFALAQVITDIMHKRPRFNLSSEYFVKTYQAECACLKLHLQLIRDILNKEIDDQREYVQRIWRDDRGVEMGIEFGLPFNIITKQPIAINNSCPALKKIYLLEFHPSLGLASRILKTLEHAYWELHHIHRPKNSDESISLEKQVLNLALEKWAGLEKAESSYSLQVQKDLFSGVFIEDPLFVRDLGLSFIEGSEEAENRPGAEKQTFMLQTFSRLLEIVTLRHRLIEAAAETALLARLYKSAAVQMGFDESHLYLRPVQFEFAAYKEKAGQPPPVFITTLLEDNSHVDRYVPSSLPLAIKEVDENQIGKFSFRTKEAVLQLMAKHRVDNLQVALACQTVQRNSLIAAVQQALFCPKEKATHSMDAKDGMSSLVGTAQCGSARESESQQRTTSSELSCSLGSRKQLLSTRKRPPEAFVSIQLEKLGPRDMMLNQFVRKKSIAGTAMKNPEEVEKIKRQLIVAYCHKFNERVSRCSLRGQIIAHYSGLLCLLQDFPTIKKTYFALGQPQEKKGERDSELGLISDPRKLHQRPRSLLSADGRTFLNLWFIPHYSEVLIMFKTLEEKVCQRALYQALEIVAALHDIFSYLCCFARLGNSPPIGSQKVQSLTAEWGGLEGIGSELQEIQAQIDNLQNPRDPAAVAKLLVLKREVMFLQFDAAVRHSIRETFLSAGNVSAFQTVTDSMRQALPAMSNSVVSSLYGSLLPLPQPLDAWNARASALFPWRTFLAREGFVPVMLGNFQTIEYSMQMCLCKLNDRDRNVANAELLAVSLLMEDVMENGNEAVLLTEQDEEPHDESVTQGEQEDDVEKKDGEQSSFSNMAPSLKTKEPISAYVALKAFLILWKQLEVFKEEWGRLKLNVEQINSVTLYKQFCKVYRLEIMYPAMNVIACQLGMEDEYERMVMDNQPLLPPKGTSDVEIKTQQLHKILESMECYLINELQKKIAKEMTLVMSERARGEATLPIDVWKHSVMTENILIVRPQIVENFIQKLKERSQETDEEITFSKDHLKDCLMTLACDVMGRERSNFETYSMCYENILRREHQLLYQKEQEMKTMQRSQTASTTPDCQLADLSHEIIIEITALRAKLTNLEEENAKLKHEIRREVRQEYDALVKSLFASCFALKGKLDEYHINMNKTVCELISEVRRKGVENMIILKRKIGSTKNDDTLQENLARQDQLQSLRGENSKLERLVCQLRTLSCWRRTVKQKQLQRSCAALEKEVIKVKKDYLRIKMVAEEEVVLLRQQLTALRKALSRSQSENEKMERELEKEKWLLKEHEHRASQELKSRQALESMKASDMERLLNDMEEKEQRLHMLSNEFERSSKKAQINHHKIDKEIKQVRCQLVQERNLKLDAFQRVSELRNQMYDFEATLSQRESVAGTMKKSPSSLCRSASSFRSILPGTGSLTPFRTYSSITTSRDYYRRCLTTDPKTIDSSGTITGGGRKVQRPQTVPSRLRNKVVEALLPELDEPTHHNLLRDLQDFRLNQK